MKKTTIETLVSVAIVLGSVIVGQNSKRKDEVEKECSYLKVGDHRITCDKIGRNNGNIVFCITGKENGFDTRVMLNRKQLADLEEFISKNHVHRAWTNYRTVKCVAKHKELTRCTGERKFSKKFFETKDGRIKVAHSGEYLVITIYENDGKVYRSMSARTYDVVENMISFKNYVRNKAGKQMMNNWEE